MSTLVCLAALRVSTAFAADVPPPELPVTLAWQAPGECPGEHEVAGTMASLLRHRPPGATSQALTVRAVVARRGTRTWVLRLTFRSARGRQTRTLRASECGPLARATALLVAVRLDPTSLGRISRADERLPAELPAVLEPVEPRATAASPASDASPDVLPSVARPPGAPAMSPPPAAINGTPDEVSRAPGRSFIDVVDVPELAPASRGTAEASPTRVRLAGHLRLEGGFDHGVLPGSGGDVGGFAGLTLRGVRIEVGVLGVPARVGRSTSAGAAGRFDRLVAALRICPGWRVPAGRGRVTIFGCLGVEAGAIRAEGTDGIARPNVQWAPWSALLFGAAARWALTGPLGLWLGVEGVGALTRPEFTVGAAAEPLFRAKSAGVRVNLGVDLQFPSRRR